MDFLDKLLAFDPANRPTVEEALKHPYLELYHDEDDEVLKTQSKFSQIAQKCLIFLLKLLKKWMI